MRIFTLALIFLGLVNACGDGFYIFEDKDNNKDGSPTEVSRKSPEEVLPKTPQEAEITPPADEGGFSVTDDQEPVKICGNITQDDVWDADEYWITCDTTLASQATLTIKPGTIITFMGHHTFTIVGNFNAQGAKADEIMINPKVSGNSGTIVLASATTIKLNYVHFKLMDVALEIKLGTVIGHNLRFERNAAGIIHRNGKVHIKDSYFNLSYITANSLDMRVSNSKFFNETRLGHKFGSAVNGITSLYDNDFSRCKFAVSGGGELVQNKFYDNTVGIRYMDISRIEEVYRHLDVGQDNYPLLSMRKNTMEGNSSSGLWIESADAGALLNVAQNNFMKNSHNVVNSSDETINLTGNYWGSAEMEEIEESILDFYDNNLNGEVIYEPYLMEKVSN